MYGMDTLRGALVTAPVRGRSGKVVGVVGTLIEAEIPGVRIGEVVTLDNGAAAEIVGFRERRALLMPFGSTEGIRYGSRVDTLGQTPSVWVGPALKGRIIDGFGEPMDGKGPIVGLHRRPLHAVPLDPMLRSVIRTPLPTGVRVIDGLLTFGKGQRVGLMAGSGVGKSTLMGMIARKSAADINVIALIGERGREVREFVEEVLGAEGLARSVVVVVPSDRSPVLQVRGSFLATAISEWFRDQGQDVLLFMDSVTRLAMAQRQIGLAAGEPPTTRGYTPSVFGLLPKLLERAGPGAGKGSITAIYTVLVDGDDVTGDPIGDAVRGIVDGHIVLSRKLASRGQYPAVDVLPSLSRVMTSVATPRHIQAAGRMRALLATWSENEELIRLGAYKAGSSPAVDAAIQGIEGVRAWLSQSTKDTIPFATMLTSLEGLCK